MAHTKARLKRWDQIVGLEVRHELVSDDLFDDLGDERDIRKLPGSVGSSPARLMTGTRIDLFWSNSMTPSTMDRLQIVVRSGSKVSRCSCRRNVSKGPSSHDFGAAAMMMRRSSAGVIAVTADSMQVVDGNVGGGEPAVSSRMG